MVRVVFSLLLVLVESLELILPDVLVKAGWEVTVLAVFALLLHLRSKVEKGGCKNKSSKNPKVSVLEIFSLLFHKFTRVHEFHCPIIALQTILKLSEVWNIDVKVRFGSNQGLWLASFECILGKAPSAIPWSSIIPNQSATAEQGQHFVFLFAYLHTDD